LIVAFEAAGRSSSAMLGDLSQEARKRRRQDQQRRSAEVIRQRQRQADQQPEPDAPAVLLPAVPGQMGHGMSRAAPTSGGPMGAAIGSHWAPMGATASGGAASGSAPMGGVQQGWGSVRQTGPLAPGASATSGGAPMLRTTMGMGRGSMASGARSTPAYALPSVPAYLVGRRSSFGSSMPSGAAPMNGGSHMVVPSRRDSAPFVSPSRPSPAQPQRINHVAAWQQDVAAGRAAEYQRRIHQQQQQQQVQPQQMYQQHSAEPQQIYQQHSEPQHIHQQQIQQQIYQQQIQQQQTPEWQVQQQQTQSQHPAQLSPEGSPVLTQPDYHKEYPGGYRDDKNMWDSENDDDEPLDPSQEWPAAGAVCCSFSALLLRFSTRF